MGTAKQTTSGTAKQTASGTAKQTVSGVARETVGLLLVVLTLVLLLGVGRGVVLAEPARGWTEAVSRGEGFVPASSPGPGGATEPLRAGALKRWWHDLTARPSTPEEVAPMTAPRTEMDRLQEMVRLHRMGRGARQIAQLLRMSPNTERDYRRALQVEGLLDGPADSLPELATLRAAVLRHNPPAPLPSQQRSRIESWTPQVEPLLARGVGPRAIFDRLRLDDPPFGGSYAQIKRLCRTLRRAQGPRAQDVAIPVETRPGDVAQVDFGYVGRLLDPASGAMRDAWCFVLVLGYSRRLVARLVFDQRATTWLRLHIEAFEELGGVPATLVPDNLKAAVVRAAFGVAGPPSALHRSYRDLAQHYGFAIDPTPPRAPKKKGKVEASVKYVKGNYFTALPAAERQDFDGVVRGLARWVDQVANARVHGTTGRIPAEVYAAEERAAMKPLPARRFEPVTWKHTTVLADSHVLFDGRMYSVPWRLIGQKVWLAATTASVVIWAEDTRVATHARRGEGVRSTVDAHLPTYRADLRHRDREHWEQRAAALGPEVLAYVQEIFASDAVLSQLRVVQAIVMHLEKVPVERARAAAARARFFACYQYAALKKILREGLDREPLPTAVAPTRDGQLTPRFARSITDLLHTEVHGESH